MAYLLSNHPLCFLLSIEGVKRIQQKSCNNFPGLSEETLAHSITDPSLFLILDMRCSSFVFHQIPLEGFYCKTQPSSHPTQIKVTLRRLHVWVYDPCLPFIRRQVAGPQLEHGDSDFPLLQGIPRRSVLKWFHLLYPPMEMVWKPVTMGVLWWRRG